MIKRLFSGILLAVALSATPAGAASASVDLSARGSRPDVKVPFPSVKDWSTVKIRLERTACYGWCPVYSVEITGDGSVAWFGAQFVEAKGSRTAAIPVTKVRALFDAFVKADFFWTFDEYSAPITDLPTQIISVSFDGHSKTIVDYAGGHVGMPKVIDDLEDAVDATAGTKVWVGNTRQP